MSILECVVMGIVGVCVVIAAALGFIWIGALAFFVSESYGWMAGMAWFAVAAGTLFGLAMGATQHG